MNDAIAASFREDKEDLAAFAKRAHEPLVAFDQAFRELKRHGKKKLDVGRRTLKVESATPPGTSSPR